MMTKRTDKTMTTANGTMTATTINKTHREQGKHSPATSVVKRILTKFESEVRTVMGGAFRRIHKSLNFKLGTFNFAKVAFMAVLALVMVFGAMGSAEAVVALSPEGWSGNVSATTGVVTTLNHANGTGSNRVIVVVVMIETNGAQSITQVTYGASTVQPITTAQEPPGGTGWNNITWIGYCNEACIAGAGGTTITPTYSNASFNFDAVAAATFTGVDQGTPVNNSNQNNVAGNVTTINTSVNNASGNMAVYGVEFNGVNANSITPAPNFTEGVELTTGGNGARLETGHSTTVGAPLNIDPTTSQQSNRTTIVGISLNQVLCTDTTPSNLTITVPPANNSTVSGNVTITATADEAMTNMTVTTSGSTGGICDVGPIAMNGTGPWTYDWNTSACGDPAENPITITVNGDEPECGNAEQAQWTNITIDNACDVTAAPTVSVDSVTNDSVTISWTTVPNAVSYKVYRGVTDLGTQTSPFTDTGRSANTSYDYTVVGVGSSPAGCEGPGGLASALTLPNAAGAPTYTGVGTTSLTVNWTAPAGGADSYDVYRGGVLQGNTAVTNYPDSGLSINTQYSYYIVAKNVSGDAAPSPTTSVYTLATTPAAPTVGNPTGNTLDVTLGADTNPASTQYAIRINGGAFTNQYVQVDGSVGALETWLNSAAWGTTTVTGLAQSTTYSFDVKARNGDAVETAFGAVGQGTTLAFDPTTTAGTATASPADSSIDVSAPYTFDDNGDNTVTVSWGLDTVDCLLGSQVLPHSASPYIYTITGLTNMTAYQVCVDYADPDGVNGVASQVINNVIPSNPLLHNSASTGSTYWGGDWGVTGASKYGQISCETCHEFRATNIKGVKSVITSPNSPTDVFPGSTVIFSDARDGSSDFGDDTGGHVTSQKVCEVCHTQTQYHRYDTTGQTVLTHYNQADCTKCHQHREGFKPSACDACHGDPPIIDVVETGVSPTTGLAWDPVATGSVTAGAHNAHVNILGFTNCATCHNGYVMPNGGDIDISFSAFGTTSGTYDGQIGVSYNGLANGTGAKSCSSVYCHGGTIGGTAAIWDGTIACGDCHAISPPTLGSHVLHAGTLSIGCDSCHGTGAGSTAAHVSGNVTWDVSALSGTTPQYKGAASGGAGLAPSTYGDCSSIYCHGMGLAGGADTIPTWGGAVACGDCHAVNNTLPVSHPTHYSIVTAGDSASDANNSTAGNYVFQCGACHNGVQHVGPNEASPVDVAISGTYGGSFAAGNCSNVYCHGNFGGNGNNATPSWGNAASAACGTCHDVDTSATMTGGSHQTHVKGVLALTCDYCHSQTAVNAAGGISDRSVHANGLLTWNLDETKNQITVSSTYRGANAGETATGITPYGACSNIYCHSNVQTSPPGGALTYATPQWGAVVNCGDCHKAGPQGPPPNQDTGSHTAHVTQFACSECHLGGGSGTANHANYAVDVAINQGGTYNGTPVPGDVYGTCSSLTCHNGGSAAWGGGPLGCEACHSGASDIDDFVYNNGTFATISTTEYNTVGHGGFGIANLACTDCHSTAVAHNTAANFFRLSTNSNTLCMNCHSTAQGGTPAVDGAEHFGADHSATENGGQLCWDCHDPHGDTPIKMIHDNPWMRHDANGLPTRIAGQGGGGDNISVAFTTTGTRASYVNNNRNGVCQICHDDSVNTMSTFFRYNVYPTVASAGGIDDNSHNPGTSCDTCHAHSSFQGSGSCLDCHNTGGTGTTGPNNRRAAVTEFGLAWGHKKSGRGAVTESDCIVCHLEGDFTTQGTSPTYHADGNIDLRDPDGAGETPITDNGGGAFTFTDYAISYGAGSRTQTLGNTIPEVITMKFCLACHDSDGATNPTARSTYGTPTQFMPFGGVNLGASYTTTNGAAAAGGLIDVASQVASGNSSRHPVGAPNNRAYPYSTRIVAPYDNIGTGRDSNTLAGNSASPRVMVDSVVMVCDDCHTTSTPVTSSMITSHGNADTLRGTVFVASPTLCMGCHGDTASYVNNSQGNHNSGSAFTTGNPNIGDSDIGICHNCHFSDFNIPSRPVRGYDVHGFNGILGGTTWTYGNASGMRPIAFLRNTTRWNATSPRPYVAPGITAGQSNCGGNMTTSGCNENHTNYSPGGSY